MVQWHKGDKALLCIQENYGLERGRFMWCSCLKGYKWGFPLPYKGGRKETWNEYWIVVRSIWWAPCDWNIVVRREVRGAPEEVSTGGVSYSGPDGDSPL